MKIKKLLICYSSVSEIIVHHFPFSFLVVEKVLLEASVLTAIDNGAVMLLAPVWLISITMAMMTLVMTILLLLHQVLIKHFLVADLVVYLIV